LTKPFAKIFIPRPNLEDFFYEIPKNLNIKIGDIVEIELISKLIWGIVKEILEEIPIELKEKNIKLKKIQQKITHTPLFEDEIQTKFLKWISNYYLYPFPKIAKQIFSPFLLKNKLPKLKKSENSNSKSKENIEMTKEQEKIVSEIKKEWEIENFKPILLFGVTGSGKSEIYANLAQTIFNKNKQVLFLVPEIGLTNSALNHFEKRFGEKGILLHSYMTRKERYSNYKKAENNEIKFIIGTRSSILYPFLNIGLIVIDEEHDQSFKNFEPPYYNARDCAIMKAKMMNIPIILGTATPSSESYYNALNNKYTLKKLTKRANGKKMPEIETFNYKSDNYIPSKIISKIKQDIKNGFQTLFFLNRRGFATVAICKQCENIETCPNCKTALIYHKKEAKLKCHHCNYSIKPDKCSKCNKNTLKLEGMGIEKLYTTLTEYFPESKIVSIDKDSIKNNKTFNLEIEKITKSQYNIITGTIMISKGQFDKPWEIFVYSGYPVGGKK
jgi:primosomal protein N' (replication factor Y)